MYNYKSVYLIDYENVSYKGLYGIGEVLPDDEIVIFYSNEINIIKDILSAYKIKNIKISYFELNEKGKNSLDFMISAYSGYAASNSDTDRIAIISNDKEYPSLIPVIKHINPDVELIFDSCIHNILYPKIQPLTPSQEQNDTVSKPNNIKLNQQNLLNFYKTNTTIPKNYLCSVAGITLKCLKENCSTKKFVDKITINFGSKNAAYIEQAKLCYDKLKGEIEK